jgi:protein-tyrosine phosphatase
MKIIQLMNFSLLDNKKLAVHCHAGKGRTGLVISSVFNFIYKYFSGLFLKII